MKQHHLRLFLLSLAVGGSGSAFAQSDLSYVFTARPKYTFSAALKIRTGGATVKFGNLGNIPFQAVDLQIDDKGVPVKDANGKFVATGNYSFHDGQVRVDGLRPAETTTSTSSVSGTVTTTTTITATPYNNGTRYLSSTTVTTVDSSDPTKTTSNTINTGDFLSYEPGQTRIWMYQDPSQVSNGSIDMHAYSSQSDGASKDAEAGSSGGFDLQLGRELGLIGKKIQWGFALSFGVNEINAKTSGRINGTLVTQTGHFSLLGQAAPTAPYTGPSAVPFDETDGNGQPIPDPLSTTTPPATLQNPTGLETTVPLSSTPTLDTTTKAGAANIDGNWKVKGAYYIMRLGPSFRYQVTKRVSFSGNAGVAGAYVGSVYTLTENLVLPDNVPLTPGVTPPGLSGEIRNRDLKFGYYGELNAEFWLSYRTGLFAGVVYERLGKYSQTLGGRTADVNIGGGLAFRIGIINRF